MSQKVTIPEFRLEDIPLSCTWIVVGPPGSGKCLAPGTPVVMFDGTIRPVEMVQQGDELMGDDGTVRNVLGTTWGYDNMYEIHQSLGDNYVVNEPHILCLLRHYAPRLRLSSKQEDCYVVKWMLHNQKKCKYFFYGSNDKVEVLARAEDFLDGLKEGETFTFENILEISVREYLKLPEKTKRKYKGYRNTLDFERQDHQLYDPYITGFLTDSEYPDPVHIDCERTKHILDSRLRSQGGCLVDMENNMYHVCTGSNFIYMKNSISTFYKKASRSDRLIFIEGFMAGHGQISKVESKTLAEDLVFMARSIGYDVNISSIERVVQTSASSEVSLIHPDENYVYFISIHPRSTSGYPRTTDISVHPIGRGEYCGFEIDGNGRFLLGDLTVTHNTTFMENMAYYLKHRYPVARLFIGTEGGYRRMCKIFHPLYVSNYYDEEEEKNHILRQRTCEIENGHGYPGNYALNIIDDASDDPKIYKTKVMKGLFKLGSQHWNQLLLVGSQYAIDMPPDVRKSVSYAAVFFEPEEIERKKLYNNLGGLAGSYDNFCDLMDQLTGDYTCIIFKKRTQSHKIEDNISYFRTQKLNDWKFGCEEYRQWAKDRYDTNYQEQIIM